MKKIVLLFVIIAGLYAFQKDSEPEKKIVRNFMTLVRDLPHEKIYLHTDKSAYTVGENIWFRAYGVHALLNVPGIPSKFIYVDLVDKRDSLVNRVKLVIRDSCFYGQLPLSKSLQQGEYCLRAYTYNMQNQDKDWVFRKKIRVINPMDSRVWTEVSYKKEKGNYYAVVRFLDGNKKPFAQMPVTYVLNPKGYRFTETRIGTDRNGEVRIKVDTSDRILRLGFYEGKPFSFERYIRIPDLREGFDVQFFPEGGSLLVGNRQQVAFKAIGTDGYPVDVEGEIFQDSIPLFSIKSEHDGMGSFWLPVNRGVKFQARVTTADGREKWFDLPESRVDGWGIAVSQQGENIEYLVMKGEGAEIKNDLYVLVHSCGMVFDFRQVTGSVKGKVDQNLLPEGISQVVLMDKEGNVYSQRQFFIKKRRSGLMISSNKKRYRARELVELELEFDKTFEGVPEGSFSLTVTDDQKVKQDSLEDNILSNLLLTSYLKGYIKDPAYYFNDTAAILEHHLDLVMQTHGWTRFDPGKIARGEFPKEKYEIEVGQVISGTVKNFWGKDSKGAGITLLSNYGDSRLTETDERGRFVIDDLLFKDSTLFFVQALNVKGRRGVEVMVDPERFLTSEYFLPNVLNVKEEDDKFLEKFSQNYYYENGQKIYVLDEVNVTRQKVNKNSSFYDHVARYQVDSAQLAELPDVDIFQLVQLQFPGVTIGADSLGNPCPFYRGKQMYILVNDFEEDINIVRMFPKRELLGMALLEPIHGKMFFGDRGRDGVLLITRNPNYIPKKEQRVNILPFRLLGYQTPEEFYVPRYDVDSVRRDNRYDERTTIYWNPVVKLTGNKKAKISFYTADLYGTYSVILEGITREGIVCRQREKLKLE